MRTEVGAVASSTSTRPVGPVHARRDAVIGWLALALATLVTSLVAMFGFGETVSSGVEGIGHFIQLAILIGIGVWAVSRRRAGTLFALFGVLGLFQIRSFGGLYLGIPLTLAGILYYFGHPQPRRLAYWLTIGVPLLLGVVTAAVVLITH